MREAVAAFGQRAGKECLLLLFITFDTCHRGPLSLELSDTKVYGEVCVCAKLTQRGWTPLGP